MYPFNFNKSSSYVFFKNNYGITINLYTPRSRPLIQSVSSPFPVRYALGTFTLISGICPLSIRFERLFPFLVRLVSVTLLLCLRCMSVRRPFYAFPLRYISVGDNTPTDTDG